MILTEAEWDIVYSWYCQAAGECASGIRCTGSTKEEVNAKILAEAKVTKALLDKLGFEYYACDQGFLEDLGLLGKRTEGRT